MKTYSRILKFTYEINKNGMNAVMKIETISPNINKMICFSSLNVLLIWFVGCDLKYQLRGWAISA